MKFKIKQWSSETLFRVILKKKDCDLWYKEQIRRFGSLYFMHEYQKQKSFKKYPIFDIDESYECWVMSIEHLNAFINFIK